MAKTKKMKTSKWIEERERQRQRERKCRMKKESWDIHAY